MKKSFVGFLVGYTFCKLLKNGTLTLKLSPQYIEKIIEDAVKKNELKVINTIDPKLVNDFIRTSDGERQLLNIITRNKKAMEVLIKQ